MKNGSTFAQLTQGHNVGVLQVMPELDPDEEVEEELLDVVERHGGGKTDQRVHGELEVNVMISKIFSPEKYLFITKIVIKLCLWKIRQYCRVFKHDDTNTLKKTFSSGIVTCACLLFFVKKQKL
jgi:hypothetical protein